MSGALAARCRVGLDSKQDLMKGLFFLAAAELLCKRPSQSHNRVYSCLNLRQHGYREGSRGLRGVYGAIDRTGPPLKGDTLQPH